MGMNHASTGQNLAADWRRHPHLFLAGPAGTGKTTAAQQRLLDMLQSGIPGEEILILVPQRTLGLPYQQSLFNPGLPAGSQPTVVTLGGLAQRMAALFWPIIAGQAGFAQPNRPPVFLTLETAQYFMARTVQPLLEKGYFESITIDRNRLYSQVIDNLNKAASVGFSPESISEKLKSAWGGKPGQELVYDQAQDCAICFRQYCLKNNLLDYSLQLELFTNRVWPSFLARTYLTSSYKHLIYDNIEEDVPVAHDILRDWLPAFSTSLLIFDSNAGYRAFLGADPESALLLQDDRAEVLNLTDTFVTPPTLKTLSDVLTDSLGGRLAEVDPDLPKSINLSSHRFYPELTDWVCSRIEELVDHGFQPGQIAILSPYLSDSLRFSLSNRLQASGIKTRSHRPSRSLRDEPATQCLLTFAALAYPQWELPVTREQVRSALFQAIQGLDLVRADLLTALFSKNSNNLKSFDTIKAENRDRITFLFGERYEDIRSWLTQFQQQPEMELDVFLSRLFGELLSQPGFGFHQDYEAARVTANLIESIQKFRQVTGPILEAENRVLGKEYIQMVQEGVLAAQYLGTWEVQIEDAVLLAPAHTFLMNNQAVDVQFWLDIGSQGWWERLYQPLTQPAVLSRHWPAGRTWTDADEKEYNQRSLSRLLAGLLARCRQQVFLCAVGIDERGNRQRGPLIRSIQSILLSLNPGEDPADV